MRGKGGRTAGVSKKPQSCQKQLKTRNEKRNSRKGTGGKNGEAQEETHIVPVRLGELHGRRSPLDSSAIDEDMDVATHSVESLLKDRLDGRLVGHVAIDYLDGVAQRFDSIVSVETGGTRALHQADGGTRLSESDGARRTDTWGEKTLSPTAEQLGNSIVWLRAITMRYRQGVVA